MVRVDFRRLDAMLEVLGEGLIQHSALAEAYRGLARRTGASEELDRLDQTVVALREDAQAARVHPDGNPAAADRHRVRPVPAHGARHRRRPRASGSGWCSPAGETPLDKAVLDRLSEPLLHLVTNAIVHGIESPEAAAAPASRRKGTVRLERRPAGGPGGDPGDGRRPRPERAGHPQEGRGARAEERARTTPSRSGT